MRAEALLARLLPVRGAGSLFPGWKLFPAAPLSASPWSRAFRGELAPGDAQQGSGKQNGKWAGTPLCRTWGWDACASPSPTAWPWAPGSPLPSEASARTRLIRGSAFPEVLGPLARPVPDGLHAAWTLAVSGSLQVRASWLVSVAKDWSVLCLPSAQGPGAVSFASPVTPTIQGTDTSFLPH